jgi:hypothetical protein
MGPDKSCQYKNFVREIVLWEPENKRGTGSPKLVDIVAQI